MTGNKEKIKRMKIDRRSGLIIALMGTVLSTAGAVASINKMETSINHTGIHDMVKIKLDNLNFNSQYTDVLPMQNIDMIPRITNKGIDCYIRTKINLVRNDEKTVLKPDDFKGMSNKWIYNEHDGYFYYTDVLNENEYADVFDSLTLPSSYSDRIENRELLINVVADAIQSKNFKPDFESNNPFSNIEIIKNDIEISSEIKNNKTEKQKLTVEYIGDTEKYLKVSDDFFVNISNILPADIVSDEAVLKNSTDNKIRLFFRSEPVESEDNKNIPEGTSSLRSGRDKELLEKIKLTIDLIEDDKSTEIYKGNLKTTNINDWVSLGTFEKGEEARLNFTLEVPSELNNDYIMSEAVTKWSFGISNEENADRPHITNTGDDTSILMTVSAFVISTLGIVFIVKSSKKKSINKNNFVEEDEKEGEREKNEE